MIPYLVVAVFGAIIGGLTVGLIYRARCKYLAETVPTPLAVEALRVRDGVRSMQITLAGIEHEVILPLPEDLEVIEQVDADIAAGRSPF